MILKNYIFSSISGVYQQYTSDYSETFIKQFCAKCNSDHQIAVHRDGNLMYYIYMFRPSDISVYGIAVVAGEICTDINALFTYLQDQFVSMANKGELFYYNNSGIVVKSCDFFDKSAEVDSCLREVQVDLGRRKDLWSPLPPEDLSIPLESRMVLSFNEDGPEKIADALRHYHNVVISVDNNNPNSFSQSIRTLSEENETLRVKVAELNRKKKQYKWVVRLSLAFVLSLGSLFFVRGRLQTANTQIGIQRDSLIVQHNTLITLQDSIIEQAGQIKSLNKEVSNLSSNLQTAKAKNNELSQILSSEKSKYESQISGLNSDISTLKNKIKKIGDKVPLIVTDIKMGNSDYDSTIDPQYGSTIYSRNTMYLQPQITYDGLKPGKYTLNVKLYRPDGSLVTVKDAPDGYTIANTQSISEGESRIMTLRGVGGNNKGFWHSGKYRYEVWYNNSCLKSKEFTIH